MYKSPTIGMHYGDPAPDAVPATQQEIRDYELSRSRANKLAQITRDRDAACVADVTVLGHPWQADIRSQQMLASAILLAQAGVYTPTVWRDADNNNMPISSVAQLVSIAGAMAAQTQAAYAASWARKSALEAATTIADVEAV